MHDCLNSAHLFCVAVLLLFVIVLAFDFSCHDRVCNACTATHISSEAPILKLGIDLLELFAGMKNVLSSDTSSMLQMQFCIKQQMCSQLSCSYVCKLCMLFWC